MSQSEYQVGVFYFKQKWYPGAIDRLRALLKSDPQFTYRDGAYYYLGEALLKVNLNAEALPLYEKLIAEFAESEYLEKGKLRLEELKTAMTKAGAPPPAETPASETAAPSTTSPSPAPAPPPHPSPRRNPSHRRRNSLSFGPATFR